MSLVRWPMASERQGVRAATELAAGPTRAHTMTKRVPPGAARAFLARRGPGHAGFYGR